MIELGIPEDDAKEFLERNQNDIQRAIDFWLQKRRNTPEMTNFHNFWGQLGNSLNIRNDQLLLEGISASLRDFQNISESPPSNTTLILDDRPCDPIKPANRPVGLIGTKQTTPLTCLIQALFFHNPFQLLLAPLFSEISDWGSYFENFDLNAEIPISNLVKELTRVFAGLQYSKRAYKSCIPFTKGFISYRVHFNLGIPITVEETWSYLSHSLSSAIPDLTPLTHFQLSKKDENRNFTKLNNFLGISVDQNFDFHEALWSLTLNRRVYLSSNDINKGKILSFFPLDGWSKNLDFYFYIDRYLDINSHLIEGLMEKKSVIDLDMQKLEIELLNILEEKIPLLEGTIDFLSNKSIGLSTIADAALIDLQKIYRDTEEAAEELKVTIANLRYKSDQLFFIPNLKKNRFQLFAIFKTLASGETIVYICVSTYWWRFQGKKVSEASLEMATDVSDKISCVWYTDGNFDPGYISNIFPEPLIALMKQDNAAFTEEIKLMS